MTTTLITGANRGIGLELCRLAADRGDEVIAVCRTPSDALAALDVRVVDGVDVSTDGGVARLAEAVGDTSLDIVINNAGILRMDRLDALSIDDLRMQLEVNSIGPLRVSAALAPRLGEGSKLAIVTSRMGSIADNTSGGQYGYRMSKAAVNAAGVSLARDLAGRGVAVVLLHPGWIRTEMTGNMGNTGPDEAAGQLLSRIDELTIETTGRFVHANGEQLPW
jgi:NAD(P)-dependent dehydrogenase (short-subunit alcohol dehydrogenase family)